MSPLLVLLPLILATLLSLPVPLLHKTHPITVVPDVTLCNVPDFIKFDIYESSVNILGFYLPAVIIILLIICLSVRRCFRCSSDKCVTSHSGVMELIPLPLSKLVKTAWKVMF